MDKPDASTPIGRRGLIGLAAAAAALPDAAFAQGGEPPQAEIERILQAPAESKHGLVHVSIGREDMTGVTGPAGANPNGPRIPFSAGFELNGDFYFQSVGGGRAILNGDFAFRPDEINPAIDAALRHGLQVQAFHQHYYGLQPMVWFMHLRGEGRPVELARAIKAVLSTTSTPFPQRRPPQQTPLDKTAIGRTLGADPDIDAGGVVTVVVPRTDRIRLGGVEASPHLNVSSNISFQPLPGGRAAAAPDFSMTAAEIGPVFRVMRSHGWAIHCLYNQETDERPQLFFAHLIKVGEPLQLAREIRAGLDQTAARRA